MSKIAGYKCPVCSTVNPPNAKHCLNCGQWLLDTIHQATPVYSKNPFKTILAILGTIFGLITFLGIIGSCMNQTTMPEPTPSLEEFRTASSDLPYDDLARHIDDYKGSKVHYIGEVVQVMDNPPCLRVDVAPKDEYGFRKSSQVILVTRKDTSGRVLENDTVEFYGIVKGLTTYTSIFGQKITIPEVTSYYLDVIKKAGE
ncbi:MAG TPA: zinc ribbon domain-containing protein [Syntrophomonadaceae bacterium]|nr:zinc ribbon domain-containing protein [Syntrophomonadaceae bacterium]